MDFCEMINKRQSCRNFNPEKEIEDSILEKIIEAGRLSPSACNSQPYFFTAIKGEKLKEIAKLTQRGIGINKFTDNANAFIIISEEAYNLTAAAGAKVKHNDYRSIDIGIATAFMTLQAYDLGVDSCIIGWFEDEKIREITGIKNKIRLIIALGYASDEDKLRVKKRKEISKLANFIK